MQDELTGLWQRFGWTVLFVTHILSEAVYLADRVVVLDRPPSGLRTIERIMLSRPRNRLDARLTQQTEELKAGMDGYLDALNGESASR